jgi:hypothetical protein
MKTGDVIGLVVLGLIFLSLIDRWFFRKLVITSRTKMDNERFKLEGKAYMWFGLIRGKTEYIEMDGKLYSVIRKSPYTDEKKVSSTKVEPRIANAALLKYKLEQGINN